MPLHYATTIMPSCGDIWNQEKIILLVASMKTKVNRILIIVYDDNYNTNNMYIAISLV